MSGEIAQFNIQEQEIAKLPTRKISFSWTATKYCMTPNQPQKLLIVYDCYFCSTDSTGAMGLLYNVTCS